MDQQPTGQSEEPREAMNEAAGATGRVPQEVQGQGKQPAHTHPAVTHTHDHWHITHHHRDNLPVGEWEHEASWHTHEHNHGPITHSHNYSREEEEQHHASEAHSHDHNHPAES